ncbi:Serine/threonine-protein kinase 16 [Conglomerata obtusa]
MTLNKKKSGDKKKNRDMISRTITYSTPGLSVYGQIIRPLGQGRFYVNCSDYIQRTAKVCGRMHKKTWITINDFVLVSLRPEEDAKGDIVCKYLPNEVKILRESHQLPEEFGNEDKKAYNIEFENI